MQRQLNGIDLFSGAGGLTLGALNAGISVRAAIEFNKHAASTYSNYFKNREIVPTLFNLDIREIDIDNFEEIIFGNEEHCDIILGGPPCQGFSTHRIKDAGIKDPRNELLLSYFKFVERLKPSAFLVENVPGMLWPRHYEYLSRFYREANRVGYVVKDPIIIDAADFGVPQRRKRVFILGIRNDIKYSLAWPPRPTHGSVNARTKNPNLLPWQACAAAFSSTKIDDPNNFHMQHTRELIDAFANTPINGGSRRDSGRVLKCHKHHDGHKDVYGRINPFTVAPTMTTACINPSKGRFVHPTENHGITARQAARIQTFPDDFVFFGGLIASGQQIGNAVPVKLAQILIEHLTPLLLVAKERGCTTSLNSNHELA